MPIATDRPIAVDTRMLASIPTEAVQPVAPSSGVAPGVQDLLAGFKNGFITMDDIQRKLADRPVEESNRQLNLQANDFKSRRLAEQEQLAPAALALESHRQALEEKKMEALEKDLNATDDIRPAKEAYLKAKATLEADLVSPEPKVRREAFKRRDNFALEDVYSATFGGEVPEFVEVPAPSKPQDFQTWAARNKAQYVAAQEAEFLQQFPQATPDTILEARVRSERDFDATAGDKYKEYARQVPFQKSYAYQGTPDYYKELNRQLTDRAQGKATEGAQFDAYKAGLSEAAKNAAGGGKVTESKVKRLNPQTHLEEDVLIRTDGAGKIISETVLAANTPAFTEQQASSKMYSTRMNFNNGILASIEQKGFDPTALGTTVQRFLPNRLKSDDAQQYESAKRNWIAAVLRKESGATITPSEMANAAAQYFPRDGDSPEVVTQKQQLRQLVEQEMQSLSGPAAPAPGAGPLPTGSQVDKYRALLGKTVTDRKTGRKGVVTQNPDGTFTIK